jgi:hypothetical protein
VDRPSGGVAAGAVPVRSTPSGSASARRSPDPSTTAASGAGSRTPTATARGPRPTRLSKDAYRRRKQQLEADLTRLGLRKTQLELAVGDPAVSANFVELRRITSELADVDVALAAAEDAWLTLEDQAP